MGGGDGVAVGGWELSSEPYPLAVVKRPPAKIASTLDVADIFDGDPLEEIGLSSDGGP